MSHNFVYSLIIIFKFKLEAGIHCNSEAPFRFIAFIPNINLCIIQSDIMKVSLFVLNKPIKIF